ncbi:protease IV [Gammaproteobacteria bacterium]
MYHPRNEQPTEPGWEREAIQQIASSIVDEQRRTRRWGIFFKMLGFLYVFSIFGLYFWSEGTDFLNLNNSPHTALIDITGIISSGEDTNADDIVSSLRAAFSDAETAGVILRINSPGGSPVQAGYVNDEIWRLRKKYPKIPIYAVVSDLCASGGYYIAVATQKIYADKASLIGSIGVRMDSFGFVDAIKKLGIERRLLTAGEHKGFLDPFLPEKPEEVEHVKGLLSEIHKQFIEVVKKGRGDRLKDDPNLFSGFIWTGEQAKALGLVDDLGSAGFVAREVIKVDKIEDYTRRSDFIDRALEHLGSSIARNLPKTFSHTTLQ